MNSIKKILTVTLLTACSVIGYAQKQFTLKAPNEKLQMNISVNKTNIEYAVSHNGDPILDRSPISMTLSNGNSFGVNPKLSKSKTNYISNIIDAPVYKRSKITDNYNELVLEFNGGYNIIFRAYNEGVAYRFVSTLKKPYSIQNEQVVFNFPSSSQKAYIPYVNKDDKATREEQFFNSFENTYTHTSLAEWRKNRLAFLPIMVEAAKGKKVCITEADLLNYPGMYIDNTDRDNSLSGVFAAYPKEFEYGGHINTQKLIKSRESYIAKYDGPTNFPWRIISVSETDAEMADNDMVFKLASPQVSMDFSWVKPGKVAWDWWNDWNLYGVNFKSGVNNETYKYYIDFASENGIEYIILDEGWATSGKADLFDVISQIDLKELISYGEQKNVGIILWAGYYAFARDMENICKHYSEMGVKGFKVDFMDSDDQEMVRFHHNAAEIAAKYKLLLDFHGTYKPTGLQRTYPNVINFEGVYGLEQMKWNPDVDQVTYDVTIPFIRMVAGPFDYTQGAMRNASKGNYRPVNSEGMSQGTRCRQLAEYVVFESPLNMLCDSPSNYITEKECTDFITSVPTTWDNTVVLNGKVGEYISIARQKGDDWYIGAMTNWDARTLELDLSFLGEGSFIAEVYRDGINADRAARDYVKEVITVPADRKIKVNMASGGGYAMKILKK